MVRIPLSLAQFSRDDMLTNSITVSNAIHRRPTLAGNSRAAAADWYSIGTPTVRTREGEKQSDVAYPLLINCAP
jgi:hypothetical protein